MFHRPRELLRKLSAPAAPLLSGFDLHAALYRLCEVHAGTLNDCLGASSWQQYSAKIVQEVQGFLAEYQGNWRARVRLRLVELAAVDTEERLVGCAGILQTLDRFHRDLRPQIEHQISELPMDLGSGRTVFLPPPDNPIADRVPPSRRLARRRGHQKHELREILDLWWHLVILDRSPEQLFFHELEPTVSELLRARLQATGNLSIALAAPFGDLDFDFYSDQDRRHQRRGVPYRFVNLKQEHVAAAQGAIDRILDWSAAHPLDVLCFPELTLDDRLLEYLRGRLRIGPLSSRPALVVAGSFHLKHGEHWRNRCYILDGRGRELFRQDKCKGFEITPELAQEMGADLCRKIGIDDRGGFEEIRSSTKVVIADCALGRLVTPICLDFCGEELREIFLESGTNLFLVPAMTPRMRDFAKRAYELGTHCRSSIFVVNSAWLFRQTRDPEGRSREPEDRDLFLGYVPAKDSVPGQPSKPLEPEALAVFSIYELLSELKADL